MGSLVGQPAAPGVDGGNPRPQGRRCSLELVSSHGGSIVGDGVLGIAIAAPELCDDPGEADRPIVHDRVRSGPSVSIATATAAGNASRWSPWVTRRNPTVPSALANWGGSPHPGQASSCAAAAGVKRSRQLGQQTWVKTDPSKRGPKDQCSPSCARSSKGRATPQRSEPSTTNRC